MSRFLIFLFIMVINAFLSALILPLPEMLLNMIKGADPVIRLIILSTVWVMFAVIIWILSPKVMAGGR